ncbi:hypothetical protein BH23BAC1_BH23BAC1_16570 [soil metagenome]
MKLKKSDLVESIFESNANTFIPDLFQRLKNLLNFIL